MALVVADAEVGHFELSGGHQEDVAHLEVSVRDTFAVDELEAVSDLIDLPQLLQLEIGALIDSSVVRSSLHLVDIFVDLF